MLYLGIDIGKTRHVAALLSADLLAAHGRYDACPTLAIENSRAGFERLITDSRDGLILTSFPGIGAVQAAKLLAGIGTIANFADARHLRSYLGWSPHATQTGTSQDSSVLSKGGNPMLKQAMYMVTMTAIRIDPAWKATYTRMVARKCSYDGRKKQYIGKMKVVGHIAGQITGVLYTLLRKDYVLLQSITPGTEPPPPQLYAP